MIESERGDLLELRPQPIETPCGDERTHRDDLLVRRPARADEVGVVGVRLSVGARSGCGNDRVLVERQHDVARSSLGKHVGDRLAALRVRDRMSAAVEHGERRERSEELRAFERGGANLEVRRARTAERTAAEQCPTQVRGAAARGCPPP
jgi:hypothetical protein